MLSRVQLTKIPRRSWNISKAKKKSMNCRDTSPSFPQYLRYCTTLWCRFLDLCRRRIMLTTASTQHFSLTSKTPLPPSRSQLPVLPLSHLLRPFEVRNLHGIAPHDRGLAHLKLNQEYSSSWRVAWLIRKWEKHTCYPSRWTKIFISASFIIFLSAVILTQFLRVNAYRFPTRFRWWSQGAWARRRRVSRCS